MQLLFIFMVSLFLLFPGRVRAATWYLSPSGSSQGGTSWTSAWTGPDHINWSVVRPGDVIEIDGGASSITYASPLSVSVSGSAGNTIAIRRSQSPGRNGTPILTEGMTVTGNYVTVLGLTVKKSTGDTITVKGGDYVTLDGLTVEHPAGRGIKADGYNNTVNNLTIKNSYIDTTDDSHGYVQADNIYMQYGSYPVIEGNTIINQNDHNYNNYGTSESHIDLLQTYMMDNITIRNNTMRFTLDSGNTQSQTFMMSYFDGYVKIYNNVLFTCPKGHGIILGPEDGGNGSEIFIWNNSIKSQEPNGYALALVGTDPGSVKAIKNNIFIAGPDGGYAFYSDVPMPGGNIIDYNIMDHNNYPSGVVYAGSRLSWSSWQAGGHDTHGYNTDPGLNDMLMIDSGIDPPVDHGIPIPEFSTDKDGTHRPQGSAWDIGAYEYGGIPAASPTPTTATTPQVSTPTRTRTPTRTPTGGRSPTPTGGTVPGDLNGDSHVDIFDYNILVANFGRTGTPGFTPADINRDGAVDIFDYNTLIGNFGR